MQNTDRWNSFQTHFSSLMVFISIFLQIGGVIACEAPPEVCDWEKKIVGLKTDNMIASGILIDEGVIITNRHVVEDFQSVLVRDFDGDIDSAQVIPHNIQIDLAILVRGSNGTVPNIKRDFSEARSQNLYVVAFDQGRNAVRVYEPSDFAHYPNLKKYPQARIHSNAKALPGNSGGAVVDQHGSLVGILASGDRRFSEIIPSTKLGEVFASMNKKHSGIFFEIGGLIRQCVSRHHQKSA
jgi:S1-C subfamily serine protease